MDLGLRQGDPVFPRVRERLASDRGFTQKPDRRTTFRERIERLDDHPFGYIEIAFSAEFVSKRANICAIYLCADRSLDSGESIERRDQKSPRSARRFDHRRGFGKASRRQGTNALGEIDGCLKIAVFIARRRS